LLNGKYLISFIVYSIANPPIALIIAYPAQVSHFDVSEPIRKTLQTSPSIIFKILLPAPPAEM